MKRSPLVQSRLNQAVSALERAGAEKLPGLLLEAFDGDSLDAVERALAQARQWAYIDLAAQPAGAGPDFVRALDEPLAKERRFARDQIGLLWAVAEGLRR